MVGIAVLGAVRIDAAFQLGLDAALDIFAEVVAVILGLRKGHVEGKLAVAVVSEVVVGEAEVLDRPGVQHVGDTAAVYRVTG
ncbi:MAG: hypothetical protein M3R04_00265 [bacterium]|nr:hypothetical protein [bacterium]